MLVSHIFWFSFHPFPFLWYFTSQVFHFLISFSVRKYALYCFLCLLANSSCISISNLLILAYPLQDLRKLSLQSLRVLPDLLFLIQPIRKVIPQIIYIYFTSYPPSPVAKWAFSFWFCYLSIFWSCFSLSFLFWWSYFY